MKNLLEGFAVLSVGALSLLIVYLIIQYNSVKEVEIEAIDYTQIEKRKNKSENYLEILEGYGDDEDIDIDSEEENDINSVHIKSEDTDNTLDEIVDDKSKSSYTKNLENYANTVKEEKLDKLKPNSKDHLGKPQKLERDEIVDEIGIAIDSALQDL